MADWLGMLVGSRRPPAASSFNLSLMPWLMAVRGSGGRGMAVSWNEWHSSLHMARRIDRRSYREICSSNNNSNLFSFFLERNWQKILSPAG
jgi:hypothetical protein